MAATVYTVIDNKDISPTQAEYGNVPISIGRTDGKKGKSGKCIVLPAISDAVFTVIVTSAVGKSWIVDHLDDLRGKIASSLNKNGETLSSDRLGVDAMLAAMLAETHSVRLTKESIAAWFAADLASLVEAAIATRLEGISQDKLEKLVAGYSEQFQRLAGRTILAEGVKNQLVKALDLLPKEYENKLAEKLAWKLVEMDAGAVLEGL